MYKEPLITKSISQYEVEGTEEEDESHTKRDMPINMLSSASSVGDSTNLGDELELPSKRSKPSTSKGTI